MTHDLQRGNERLRQRGIGWKIPEMARHSDAASARRAINGTQDDRTCGLEGGNSGRLGAVFLKLRRRLTENVAQMKKGAPIAWNPSGIFGGA